MCDDCTIIAGEIGFEDGHTAGRAEREPEIEALKADVAKWKRIARRHFRLIRSGKLQADAIRSLVGQIPLETEAGVLTQKGLDEWLATRAEEAQR